LRLLLLLLLLLLLFVLQVTTPVAIMTSDAKGNHDRISGLMDSHNWFGRSPESFRLFRCVTFGVISVKRQSFRLFRFKCS
jgi:hypothetical protein